VLLIRKQISTKVSIPQSARAHIIGKQGSKIKELQERTGARIQVPKAEDASRPAEDDDDAMIDIVVEGNALSVGAAQREVLKIASERAPTITARLRNIPAELYPFIAGPQNEKINELEEARGVQIRVPPYHKWRTQPPPQKPLAGKQPAFLPAADDNHITIAGDRPVVQSVKAEIERLAEELRRQITVDQFPINNGRHQFIVGKRGVAPQKFFSDTGCAIILPHNEDDDLVTIIGPAHQTPAARNLAINLAASMQSSSIDISRQHRNAPGASATHARNLTQYLRHRKAIEELEKAHQAHIVTSLYQDGGAAPWELYSRDYNNAINAQAEITNIVSAYPPSRLATVPVDPFFHMHLQNDITPRVKKDYGVHVVVPQPSEPDAPVLLVFEGEAGLNPDYQVPRGQPSPDEIRAFEQSLRDAQKHILDIISAQAQIVSTSIDVPKM
jgi:rRNA processing protein Krr1/Pno1